MVTYQSIKTYCPNCEHVLFRGALSFGPRVVEYKKCNQVISTGLTEWTDLSFFQKLGVVLRELFAPAFVLPGRDSTSIVVMNFFIWCFSIIVLTPLIILSEKIKGNFLKISSCGLVYYDIQSLFFLSEYCSFENNLYSIQMKVYCRNGRNQIYYI